MIPPFYGLLGIEHLTARGLAWTVAILGIVFVGSLGVVALLLVQMPATYFLDHHAHGEREDQHPVLRWTVRIVKNLVGAVLVGVGILMLVTPGQGVLTILIGVMLMDFPGKHRLARKLIGRPRVLRAINRLRARYNKPPVVLE